MTWAVEWRSTWRPASVSSVTMATLSPSWSGRPRSTSSPSTVAATAALASRDPIDAATSAEVVLAGYSRAEPSGRVIVIGLAIVEEVYGRRFERLPGRFSGRRRAPVPPAGRRR
jgi:hypothetical protein